MKIYELRKVVDNGLPVWVNDLDKHFSEYFDNIVDLEDRYRFYDVKYITLDGTGRLTIEV